MLNIGKQGKLDIKIAPSSITSVGTFGLALSGTLGTCLFAVPLQGSTLASEPFPGVNQQEELGTTMSAFRTDQSMLYAEMGSRSDDAGESAFNFPQNFIPPGDGRPDNTRGSGARSGSCAIAPDSESDMNIKEIRPVMPSESYGLTFQSHPTIFIDFDGHSAPVVSLRVVSETGEYDERVILTVDSDQAIQGFTLPSDRPPLEVGKNYLWTLMVACDGEIKPYHPLFTGWVQRVAPTPEITEQLMRQSITDQVEWYAERGYWYDLVDTLQREIITTNPDNAVVVLWTQLLTFVEETDG